MKAYFLILFLGFSVIAGAQNQFVKNILVSANENASAMKEKDYAKIMEYVHPNIISLGGGKDLMLTVIESQMTAFTDQNIEIADITYGDPTDIVVAGEELHCVLPQTMSLSMNGQSFSQETNLLAASIDNGETWKFVDLTQYDRESLKIFLPNFNDDLKVPIR